jgi:hypothetical protein
VKDRIDVGQGATHRFRRTDVPYEQFDAAVEITRGFAFRTMDLRIETIERPYPIIFSEKCGGTMRGDEPCSPGN